jgi:hypothetical protein
MVGARVAIMTRGGPTCDSGPNWLVVMIQQKATPSSHNEISARATISSPLCRSPRRRRTRATTAPTVFAMSKCEIKMAGLAKKEPALTTATPVAAIAIPATATALLE